MLNIYMEIHVFSTLAYENKKEKKGNPPNHYLDKQTYIARDTWMPSLENWGGGLKILVHMQCQCQCVSYKIRMPENSQDSFAMPRARQLTNKVLTGI